MLDASKSQLLVIDLQERLLPAITDVEKALENARKLISAAEILEVPIAATEQYPQGLGATVRDLLPANIKPMAKTTFDSLKTPAIAEALDGDKEIVVTGTEAHVCVLQTVMGLLARQRRVFVVTDAVGSRIADNRIAALERMRSNGAHLVTTEMVIFEWVADSSNPKFREILEIIK